MPLPRIATASIVAVQTGDNETTIAVKRVSGRPVSAILTVVSLWLTFRLELHPGFEYLLPQDRPSVRELHRVANKTSGISTLFVVLYADEGTPDEARAAPSSTAG